MNINGSTAEDQWMADMLGLRLDELDDDSSEYDDSDYVMDDWIDLVTSERIDSERGRLVNYRVERLG